MVEPEGPGPYAVAILIHGGCFLSMYNIEHNARFAEALTESGIAVWNLEYRRVGNEGGGWPGTFEDIAHGADHLRVLAKEYPIDLERVISIGHSAGGHLAWWGAARHRLADDGPIRFGHPISPKGVLALASVPDLAYLHEKRPCEGAVDGLVGGSPEDVPGHYAQASLVALVPLGLPQILINGHFMKHDHVAWRERLSTEVAVLGWRPTELSLAVPVRPHASRQLLKP